MNRVKICLSVGVVSAVSSFYGASALAAEAIGSAAATIVTPVSVTNTQDLNFGAFQADASGDVVILSDAASPSWSATNTSALLGATYTAGAFEITGTIGASVIVTVTDGTEDLRNGATILGFTPSASPSVPHTITGVAATDTIYVGGTLTIPAAAPEGVYSSTDAYKVTVNYQ